MQGDSTTLRSETESKIRLSINKMHETNEEIVQILWKFIWIFRVSDPSEICKSHWSSVTELWDAFIHCMCWLNKKKKNKMK